MLRADIPHIGGNALLKLIKRNVKELALMYRHFLRLLAESVICMALESHPQCIITKHGCACNIQAIASHADIHSVICIRNL